MAKISILGLTALLVFFSWAVSICDSLQESVIDEDNSGSFFTVSSFRYPKSQVRPYDTRYIRGTVHLDSNSVSLRFQIIIRDLILNCVICCVVDLPPWFSSLNVAMESDVGIVSFLSCSLKWLILIQIWLVLDLFFFFFVCVCRVQRVFPRFRKVFFLLYASETVAHLFLMPQPTLLKI